MSEYDQKIVQLLEQGRVDAALEEYHARKDQARSPDQAPLRMVLSKAMSDMVYLLGEKKRFAKCVELLDEQKALVREFPNESEMVGELAKGALNLLNAYLKRKKHKQAREMYEDLKDLAEKHDNSELYLALGDGGFDLLCTYLERKDIRTAQAMYEDMKVLAGKYDDDYLRKSQAEGVINLIFYNTRKKKDLESALRLYEELKGLTANHDSPELSLNQAMAATNLGPILVRAGRLEKAEELYSDQEALAEKHDDRDLWDELAMGGFNMVLTFSEKGDLGNTRYWLERVKDLDADYELPGAVRARMRELEAWLKKAEAEAGRKP